MSSRMFSSRFSHRFYFSTQCVSVEPVEMHRSPVSRHAQPGGTHELVQQHQPESQAVRMEAAVEVEPSWPWEPLLRNRDQDADAQEIGLQSAAESHSLSGTTYEEQDPSQLIGGPGPCAQGVLPLSSMSAAALPKLGQEQAQPFVPHPAWSTPVGELELSSPPQGPSSPALSISPMDPEFPGVGRPLDEAHNEARRASRRHFYLQKASRPRTGSADAAQKVKPRAATWSGNLTFSTWSSGCSDLARQESGSTVD